MSRQRAQVEFFPLPVPGKTSVPRRIETPCFAGAHDALENALGNRSRLVPGRSKTKNSPRENDGSQSGTTLRGGTLVSTPVGGDRELRSENSAGIDLPGPGTTATTARPLAPGGFGFDWRGQLVDLRGLRPGEDGRAPIFTTPKPDGLQ
jgi:hypothetical protein